MSSSSSLSLRPFFSRVRRLASCLLAFAACAASSSAQVWYVDADALGAGNGTSWADAFTSLDAGLAAAGEGHQVWVAEGTYVPAVPLVPSNPRTATFVLADDVAVYGGFAGGEVSLEQRDPVAHPVVLSGDLGVPGDASDNAYHVVFTSFSDSATRLDGLVLADGNANGASLEQRRGAGLYGSATKLTVQGCEFRDNASSLVSAAALVFAGSAATFRDCTFRDNGSGLGVVSSTATVSGCTFTGQAGSSVRVDASSGVHPPFLLDGCSFDANAGAGLIAVGGAAGTLQGCTFADGLAPALATAGAGPITVRDTQFTGNAVPATGAAAFLTASARMVFERCTFEGNTAGTSGGAIFADGSPFSAIGCTFLGNVAADRGGAVTVHLEDAGGLAERTRLLGCTFLANQADEGGAVAALGGVSGLTPIGSHPIVASCVFSGNAADSGGALYVNGASLPVLSASTLSGNTAVNDGGGVYGEASGSPTPMAPTVRVSNAILWGNADSGGVDESAQVVLAAGTLLVDASCVQGWTGGLGGAGNHGLDPLLEDADGADGVVGTLDDDLRLHPGSPGIDAGDNALLPDDDDDLDCDGALEEPVALDIARVRRVDDDPFQADTGAGPAPVVDMGAHERSAWRHEGHALAGASGEPCLLGTGTLLGGSLMGLDLTRAAPGATAVLVVGFTQLDAPFKGGVLVPKPDLALGAFAVPGSGAIALASAWPAGLPGGVSIWMQWWIADGSGPAGFTASNGLRATTP